MSGRTEPAVNYPVESHPVHIGLASTLFASVIPDTMLNMAGRFVFALFTAVAASLISRLVTDTFRKK